MVANGTVFDPSSPCLVIAPHLEYPVRTGADILIDRKYAYFSKRVPFVDLVGRDTIVRYERGRLVRSTPYRNTRVSKPRAVFRTLHRRSHYLLEKLVTPSFSKVAGSYLSNPRYKTVVFSFLWTASLDIEQREIAGRLRCIETHNDEFLWYENIRNSSANPVAKLAARMSEGWATAFMEENGLRFVFLHVSETDHKGFLSRFPDHQGYVVPTGVEEMREATPGLGVSAVPDKARLIFVGSLGVKINQDALRIFESKFYPRLKKDFGEDLEVLIVGKSPSRKVVKLCENMDWSLYPDVSEQMLAELYGVATFSILPFGYTTGSKLKLLDSLARGVPYLATESLRGQVEEVSYPCLISDVPGEWSGRIQQTRERGIATGEREALREQAREYSWDKIAHRTFEVLG